MNNFSLLIPEFMVAILAFLILSLDLFLSEKKKQILGWIGSFGFLVILFVTIFVSEDGELYEGLLVFDDYTHFFRIFFLISGGLLFLISREYLKNRLKYQGEYYAILVFTVLAGMLLSSSSELLTAYISLELLSFGLYVLVAYDRYNPKSNEAGVKYVLLGAFSSALILYGLSNIYGIVGTTRFDEIALFLTSNPNFSPGLAIGFMFLLAGLGFKLAAVPFHMWAPDVYEGAPLPVTTWLAIGSKVAIIALVLRFFCTAFLPAVEEWQLVIIVLSIITMIVGNLSALVQTNIKRLLAYSSIGHVGYILMGIAALSYTDDRGVITTNLTQLVSNGIIFHIIAYSITNFAAFICVIVVYNQTGSEKISDFAGLSDRSPLLALVLVCALFSLAGLPIFAGFTSKFYLFNAVGAQGLLWLVGVAIAMSVVSLYYYLMVARQLYIEKGSDTTSILIPASIKSLLIVLLFGMILGGVYPKPLIQIIQLMSNAVIS